MRKVFDVRAFQAGYFLLAALSFNSLTAGRRFMSLLTVLVLLWGAALLLLRFREQKLRMFRTGSLYGRDQTVSGQLCGELTVEPVLWNCR